MLHSADESASGWTGTCKVSPYQIQIHDYFLGNLGRIHYVIKLNFGEIEFWIQSVFCDFRAWPLMFTEAYWPLTLFS